MLPEKDILIVQKATIYDLQQIVTCEGKERKRLIPQKNSKN